MKKRFISAGILIAYSALLIKIMVFKDVPAIKVGSLILNFGGTEAGRPANFVPFKTIVPYLLGYKGWIIAGINLVGNVALLVPLGFLLPLVYPSVTWKKSLGLAVVVGLGIEEMQTVLHLGIFDVDDVILNALGVMVGYFMFMILAKWMRSKNYKNIIMAAIMGIAVIAAGLYVVYPQGSEVSQRADLCSGTGGNGQIVNIGNNAFMMQRKDGISQIINLTSQAMIKTSAGSGTVSDLKIGDRVTLVGGPNPDGSFTADAVFVCTTPSPVDR